MDGTSPVRPIAPGWAGAACAPMNGIIEWPAPQLDWYKPPCVPLVPVVEAVPTFNVLPPTRLSDEDVVRVARRVVELLREAKP